MKNNNIQNYLIKLGHDIIFKKIQSSFLLLALNNIELKSEYTTLLNYDKPKELAELENCITKSVFELDKFFTLSKEDRISYTEDIITKKESLENIIASVNLYNCELENISLLLKYYFIRLNAKSELNESEFIETFNNDALIDDCLNFIKTNDPNKNATFKSFVLSCFPLYLTKEKYSDLICEHLKNEFEDYTKDFLYQKIAILKRQFSPTKSNDYGKYFGEISNTLENILTKIKINLELDEIDSLNDDISVVENDLFEIDFYMEILLECFNSLIIILNFTDDIYNIDDIFTNKNEYKDLFFVVKENATNNELQFYDETIQPKIENHVELLLDDILSDEKKFNKLLGNINSKSNSPTLGELVDIIETLNFLFYQELEFMNYPSYEEELDGLTLDEIVDDLKDYFKKSLLHLPIKSQKIIKQSFFTKVKMDLSMDDIYLYLNNSIKNTSDYLEKAVILYKINELFESYNFNNENDDDDCDDDCDCEDHCHHE